MNEGVGDFIKLYDDGGIYWILSPDNEQSIDAAVSLWIESGGTRDTLLDLTSPDGSNVRLPASNVRSWHISTPESRRRNAEWNALYRMEVLGEDEDDDGKEPWQ